MSLSPPASAQVDLLPLDDPEWDWKSYERFCLGFVRAQPDVVNADLYGTRGQAQKGIDIVARLVDDRTRTYQCRKWKSFSKANVNSTVDETTYEADEHIILVTCEVGTDVRDRIAELDDWSFLDKENISREVREIESRERARRLVQDTFTPAWRRAFLGPVGPLGFWEPGDYFAAFLSENRLFRHTWDLVGREALLQEILKKLAPDGARVVVIVGRGGIGKTRLLRAVAEGLVDRAVLFADDHVPLTAESVEELPETGPVVIVDDVHRRDDLGVLMGALRYRSDGLGVILATRPQRLEELRSQLSLAGLEGDDVWVTEPLSDLEDHDVEDLARQALGDEHAHLASNLAAATADCPLVTVVGGQLLAQKAVPPELLERENDFRRVVLDRFHDEMLGQIGEHVDAGLARELLTLVSALGPVSIEADQVIGRIAEDLGLEPHAVRDLIAVLDEAGLLLARGRLRRVIPDVLADHILHRACIDNAGNPTGRSDALMERYGDISLRQLLRNLAELDWRIGQGDSDLQLLAGFWHGVAERFAAADASGRLRVIDFVKPVAALAPDPILGLVRRALEAPANTSEIAEIGYRVDDGDVRRELPPLLGSVALSMRHLPEVVSLLWQLGRDDDRPLHSHPNHGLRVLEDLASYRLPLGFHSEIFWFVERTLEDGSESERWAHSPLELLSPLLAREGTTTIARGLEWRMRPYAVDAKATAEIRGGVRELLVRQAIEGPQRNRPIAAKMLGDALAQPHGYFGRKISDDEREQWREDQLQLIDAIAGVMVDSNSPHVRLRLRGALEWHASHSAWPEVRERAAEIRAIPMTEDEELTAAIREPVDWLDEEASIERVRGVAAKIVAVKPEPGELAERLDTELAQLEALGESSANAAPLLDALARSDAGLARGLADWLASNPGRPLARFGDSVLVAIDEGDDLVGLLEQLRAGNVAARRRLASYLAMGRWFGDPRGSEKEMLRELVSDEDAAVVKTALLTILRLGETEPELAVEIALEAKIGEDPHLADDLCMAVDRRLDVLTDDQVQSLLGKLTPVTRLEFWPNRVLTKLMLKHREAVVEFLLSRVAAGGRVESISFHEHDVAIAGDLGEAEQTAILRRVRDAATGADGRERWELGHLYWRLAGDIEAALGVLAEWLVGDDEERVDSAIGFLDDMPWTAVLEHPDFVSEVLDAAQERDGLEKLRGVLLTVSAVTGDHSRTVGEPAPRDVRLRDEGAACAQRFEPGSPARLFFEDVVKAAERNIKEEELEDEEFPELS